MKYSVKRNLHTDFSVFEQNKLAPRSYFIPFPSAEELQSTDYKNERYSSGRVEFLSGEWDFAYFEKLSQVPQSVDTDSQKFDKINVPCTWQRTGYDQIAYINTRYPFPKNPPKIPQDVAVGIYRKKFSVSSAFKSHILTFLGVAGATAVYLNGSYVGYSEGSHNTAEFDITDYVSDGENELFAVVYKWSNGSYLEDQDMFRENGIFRDVYVVSREENYINDFLFRPSKNSDGTYDLKISIDGKFSENCEVGISAKGRDGEVLFEAVLSYPETETVIKNIKAKEWSAEIPNVYETYIILTEDGREQEAVRTYIGFKDVRINGEVFLFNGKPIKMKGVNHHDTHMTKGYAMGIDDMQEDILLMKAYNCNTVRTSHYPPDPIFMIMCDIYGLYVVDEADIETHGVYSVPGTYRPCRLSNDLKWAPHYLDRVKRMYERDKNHPSVTMWSLGNESGGYKCQDVCYDFLKKNNPEIPVHYEGAIRSKRWAYDVVSRMYAYPPLMRKILNGTAGDKYKGKPFFQCEYAHAMGNGPGGLEEYMQLFYSSDQFMGGCIWEWADHSVYDENAKYKWTYGGDHGEPIHDGNFCVDGLFYPDRKPSSGALEMKVVYRPVRAKYLGNGKIELWNTRSFADTSDIDILCNILVDSETVESGKIDINLAPGEKKQIAVKLPEVSGKDLFVNLTYNDKRSGFEIAVEQLDIARAALPMVKSEKTAEITDNGDKIEVKFNGGSAVFEKDKGLVSYIVNGKNMLLDKPLDGLHGLVPHVYRGRLDNDQYMKIFWMIVGLDNLKTKMTSCKIKEDNNGKYISTAYNFVTRGIFIMARSEVIYRFDCDGKITVTANLKKICPFTNQLPRFGVHGEFIDSLNNVSYYGRGPLESYSDFKEHTTVGLFDTTVDKMAHKYIKPQDSGNRTEVRFAELTDSEGSGVRFNAKLNYLNFNANPFTLNELVEAKHIEDLPDKEVTFVSADGFVRGTASGSCGPIPDKEHRVRFGYLNPLSYTFEIEPII
ncbi:MAG: glycoside hydrolase family 2 TIM barrel-domain containing protein [Clostridia bacterium]|nr:glycoside hydrolase family 2 TIM barrel-domain containing protein [Clostridia bacterium]